MPGSSSIDSVFFILHITYNQSFLKIVKKIDKSVHLKGMNFPKLRNLVLGLIIVTVSLVPKQVRADSFWQMASVSDYQSQIAISYGITFTTYTVMRTQFDMPYDKSLLWSAVTGLALGALTNKYLISNESSFSRNAQAEALGVTAATLFNVVIHF